MVQPTSAAADQTSACPAVAPTADCPLGTDALGLANPVLYADGFEFRSIWARMRAADQLEWTQVSERDGFWSVLRYDDADRVLRDAKAFTSERGTLLNILGQEDPAGGRQIAATDPPRHTVMRARLQKALAVKAIEQQQELITNLVREVIDPLAEGGAFDFAEAMLALPVAVGGTSMGLPRADWPRLARLLNASIAAQDPEYCIEGGPQATLDQAHRELFAYFQDIYHERRRNLGNDLISVLITTEVDGRTMSPGEVMSNCYSVLLGAVVTTPHSPNYLMAEHDSDGLLDRWASDLAVTPTAVEEALRLGSPVSHFMRYAVDDIEVRGTKIKAGQAVVVWLGAANRDPLAFPDPEVFDLRRKPNKHLAFGIGPHYCVGHTVARVTLRILFNELLSRFTGFTPAGEAVRLHSNFISGYKHLPITAKPVPGSTSPTHR
jgi:cytochrome P450